MNVPLRQVRATYTADTITVYQAYRPEIAIPAVAAGRFVPPFSRERMTWIKPSFRWMMYRCGWGTKPGQEHVLAIEITRSGFEWALSNACLSHYVRDLYPDERAWREQLRVSPVRVQWDPERSIRLGPLPHRSLQVGLSGPAVVSYVDEWTVGITDVTERAHAVHEHVKRGDDRAATTALPREEPYPLPPDIADAIGASPEGTSPEGTSPQRASP